MKHGYAALGAALTVALLLTAINPAAATESSVADDIRDATSAQAPLPDQSAFNSVERVEVGAGSVSAPAADNLDIEIDLPGTAQVAQQDQDLTLNVTEADGYTTALQDTGGGTFRALLHIESETAPPEFRFEFDENVELVPLEDGGVVARDVSTGDLLGVIQPAWAVDANGASVPTSYRVDGATLVQSVALTSATAFPVIADPFWIPALLLMARLSAHAASQAAARGVSQALIKQVVQNGVKSAGNKGTSIFTQGAGKNRIRVIVDNRTGNIITVTKG